MAANYEQNLQIGLIFLDAGHTIPKISVTSTPLLTKPAAKCQLQRQATVISEREKWKVRFEREMKVHRWGGSPEKEEKSGLSSLKFSGFSMEMCWRLWHRTPIKLIGWYGIKVFSSCQVTNTHNLKMEETRQLNDV
jgi:hypothetical protein